jgi:hypothetical protein
MYWVITQIFMMIVPQVWGHGFMIGPVDCNSGSILGRIRNYDSISYNIDSLRNPATSVCRGASPEEQTAISIDSAVCIALAISNGANHIGPCKLEFQSTSGDIIEIGEYAQCLTSAQRVSCNVPNLVTGDMCRYDLSFDVQSNFPANTGFLRWHWIAQHIGPPYEEYENCIDVNLNGGIDYHTLPQTRSSPTSSPSQTTSKSQSTSRTPTPTETEECLETPTERPRTRSKTRKGKTLSTVGCINGEMRCKGSGFETCNFNEWVWRECGTGTTCEESQNGIVCN